MTEERDSAIPDHRRAEQALCPDGKSGRPRPGRSTRRARADSCLRNCAGAWRSRACRRSDCSLPQTFELPPRDAEWVERNIATLQKMGIGIEAFGTEHLQDRQSADAFSTPRIRSRFMRDVIDDLRSASNSSSALRLGEDMIAKTVCRHAVKANDPLRYLEVEKLIQRSARVRLALLLSAWPADHDSDFTRRAGEKIRSQSVILLLRDAD